MSEKEKTNHILLEPLTITEITSLRSYITLSKSGVILNVCTDGCLISITRDEFIPKNLRTHLNIDCLIGEPLVIYLPQMNLDIEGEVGSTKYVGNGIYNLFLNFSENLPEYWKECLIDLLPTEKLKKDKTCTD